MACRLTDTALRVYSATSLKGFISYSRLFARLDPVHKRRQQPQRNERKSLFAVPLEHSPELRDRLALRQRTTVLPVSTFSVTTDVFERMASAVDDDIDQGNITDLHVLEETSEKLKVIDCSHHAIQLHYHINPYSIRMYVPWPSLWHGQVKRMETVLAHGAVPFLNLRTTCTQEGTWIEFTNRSMPSSWFRHCFPMAAPTLTEALSCCCSESAACFGVITTIYFHHHCPSLGSNMSSLNKPLIATNWQWNLFHDSCNL